MTSNFFAVREGTIFTAREGVLEGVTRQVVLDVAAQNRIPILFQPVVFHDLGAMSEAFRHLLFELGYSLQANSKTKEGTRHPDRDAQFRHINAVVARQFRRGHPAISVDTKKKEFWRPSGTAGI